MRKQLFVLLLIIVHAVTATAQNMFLPAVKVRFERTMALANTIKDVDPELYKQNKAYLPQTMVTYFDFTGNEKMSYYEPIAEGNKVNSQFADFYIENLVFTDLQQGKVISTRKVFSQEYSVTDSVYPIKWQFTGDRRNIAGFNCRKAIGLLYDTVVLFAFYAENILVKGGPESINGLPGMILGVGIPRVHITWFATKVEILETPLNAAPPKPNIKSINRREFTKQVDNILKRLGEYRKMIFAVII